ncbi:MAG: serine hydrolase, partial [Hyphomicrobiaceae bacterium]|nr:serine hydrolase [Hyphomicrobiaceae bacterium]
MSAAKQFMAGWCGRAVWAALCMLWSAQTLQAAPRQTALVVDAYTGRTLYESGADAAVHPASLTKLMTVYMLFDALARKRITWASRIPISDHAAAQPPSRLGLQAGDSIDVRSAIKALVVKSANDIAAAVAEFLGGNEDRFAAMMTRRARALGLRRTVFRNASGLPDGEQVTTARDMAHLALRIADEFPEHFHLFSLRRFSYRGRSYRNHNGLLGRYPGANGMKTGYIRASGFNLVASVRRNRRHVIGVVFGGQSARRRNATMRRLLNAALPHASTRRSILRRAPQIAVRPRQRPSPRIAAAGRPGPRPVRANSPRLRMARVRTIDVRSRRPDGRNRGRAPVPAAVARRPVPVQQPDQSAPVRRGRPPATLNSQAARLARFATAPAPAALPPLTPARRSALGGAPSAGRYQIQVGAYRSEGEARSRLSAVHAQLRMLLANAQPVTIAVPGKPFYRARFAGF